MAENITLLLRKKKAELLPKTIARTAKIQRMTTAF